MQVHQRPDLAPLVRSLAVQQETDHKVAEALRQLHVTSMRMARRSGAQHGNGGSVGSHGGGGSHGVQPEGQGLHPDGQGLAPIRVTAPRVVHATEQDVEMSLDGVKGHR